MELKVSLTDNNAKFFDEKNISYKNTAFTDRIGEISCNVCISVVKSKLLSNIHEITSVIAV